jgi:GNAT superfamily N-acetyltransferase
MNSFVKTLDRRPNDCDDKDIGDFMAFVLAGDEVVSDGLEGRIRGAERLVFLRVCGCLSGVAALKPPDQHYRKDISSKSGIPLPEETYPFELGWVFVMPSARRRNFSVDLTRAALSAAGTAGVFATSRTDNVSMHATLSKFGFAVAGSRYPSNRGNHQLQLFVRNPNHQATPAGACEAAIR